MELINFTQCTTNLNFDPIHNLNIYLTPTAYSSELLNGFNHEPSIKVLNCNRTDGKLLPLLKNLYNELSYIEILRLSSCLEKVPHLLGDNTQEEFFSTFGLKLDINLKQINLLVTQLPQQFLNWCAEKKWGPQDFAPLRSFSEGISQLAPYLEKLNRVDTKNSPFSKSDGTQVFELLVELLMLNKNLTRLLSLELSQWLPILKRERFPITTTQNQNKEDQLKKFSWPLHSQAKWARKGDKSGVELKLFISNAQELERSLIKLEQLKGKDLWSID
jgi:hypothetical protein